MVASLATLLAARQTPKAKSVKPSRAYTERDLIEVAVEILNNEQFRKSALRWLNTKAGK